MELSKQGQPSLSASMGSQPLPAPNTQSNQIEYPSMFYPDLPATWGAEPLFSVGASVPTSSYFIVPTNEQSVQVSSSRSDASHLLGVRPLSRVSLRPPQQVLNIQTSLPTVIGSQPSPSTASKKLQQTVASPKVQMLKSGPPQSSSKRSSQKELSPKVQPQHFESVRSKFRESLAAALCMDSDQPNRKESAEKVPPAGSAGEKQVEGNTLQDPTATTSDDVSTTKLQAVSAIDARKCDGDGSSSGDLGSNMITSMNNKQQLKHVSSEDEVLNNRMVVTDELLQGHGLCWASDIDAGISESLTQPNLKRVRASDSDAGITEFLSEPDSKRTKSEPEATEDKSGRVQKAENLSFRIEEELFKLFGGVNKKYKEKGRSLLFNLKDKNNPELRERVLSGDIAPERLCSMTAEELASKELSQWRLAKAEELAQMVVLPDTEVDVRRLVRKTHKGEFQVEVEEPDGISVEVELGGNLLSHVPSKTSEGQAKSDDKTRTDDKTSIQVENKVSNGIVQDEDAGTGNNNLSGNLDIDNEKTDLMQELMVEDLKDPENLPPILSLDEFMEALDSEPPFENLSVETVQEDSSSSDKAGTTLESEKRLEPEDKVVVSEKLGSGSDLAPSQDNRESKSESPKDAVGSNLDPVEPPEADLLIKSCPDKVEAKKRDVDNSSNLDPTIQCKTTDLFIRESIWEGALQLTLSSLTNVVAIFKSGEKPSIKEWPSLIEIKGRVKLGAFQEFLEQLPKSRSRAIMVTELCWKEGSLESGRQHLLQTIDSYIADERVGVAEPVDGVELYLCPSQGKTVEMLAEYLPKEQAGSLAVTGTSVIGVVVWRRPHASSRAPSQQRHDGSKRHSNSSSKQQQVVSSNSVPRSSLPINSYGPPPGFYNQHHHHEDDVTDDVPPGFGPSIARNDDDLPEFDFVSTSNAAANVTSQPYKGQRHVLPSARPAERMRELVQKYGKRSSIEVEPWNDDDDIPEWNPNQSNHQQTRQLPPPQKSLLPPPPPAQHMQPYQQPQQHYHQMQPLNHQLSMAGNHLMPQAYLQPQQYVQPVQQLQPAQTVQPGWQPNAWWPASGAPPEAAPALNMVQQPRFAATPNSNVQAYGVGNLGAMGWRPR